MKVVSACLAVLLLSGCAAGGHCAGTFPYQQAELAPQLQSVDGIQVPESSAALRVPPQPELVVPYAMVTEDPRRPGRSRVSCLDVPPRLPQEQMVPAEEASGAS
jgi:hypothetical protein